VNVSAVTGGVLFRGILPERTAKRRDKILALPKTRPGPTA